MLRAAFSPACLLFVLCVLLFGTLDATATEHYFYSVRRGAARAEVSDKSRRDDPAAQRRAWTFEPKSVNVVATVKERMANTKVTFSADPIGTQRIAEISMRIPADAYVNYLEMKIGEETLVGEVKRRDQARQEFNDAVEAGDSASLVETKGSMFSIGITLEEGEGAEITVGYQQYLEMHLGSYEYNLALDTRQDSQSQLPAVRVELDIDERDGLSSIAVPQPDFDCAFQATRGGNNFQTCGLEGSTDKAWIRFETLQKAQVFLSPTQQDQKRASWGGSWYGLSLDLIVRITPLSTFHAATMDGGVMMIDESGHFVHMFSAGQTTPMNKAVVLMMDRSGSMSTRAEGRTRMEQAQEAVTAFLSQLESADYFSVGSFNHHVDWWESPHLKPATPANVERAMRWVEYQAATGGTDIHESLLQALAVFGGLSGDDGALHGAPDHGDAYPRYDDACYEWDSNADNRMRGTVTMACVGLLTLVFVTSVGLTATSQAARAAISRLTAPPVVAAAHPAHAPTHDAAAAAQSGVIIHGSHLGSPSSDAPSPPPVSTRVCGSHMGATTGPDSPAAPPLPLDSTAHHPAATAPPPPPPYAPSASQPAAPSAPPPSSIPVAVPAGAPLQGQAAYGGEGGQEEEAEFAAGALRVARSWALALLVCSVGTCAVCWATIYVPLALLAGLFGAAAAVVVLHATSRALSAAAAVDSAAQTRPGGGSGSGGCCCCSTWASCMSAGCGLAIAVLVLSALAWMLCLVWGIVLLNLGQRGHSRCFPGSHAAPMDEETAAAPLDPVSFEQLADVLRHRNKMVVFLSDGHATSGVTGGWEIAESVERQVARTPSGQKPAVFGVGFGRNADLELLQLVSKGTGATATRIYDDNAMDVQLEGLFQRVSSAVVSELQLEYTALETADCGGAGCSIRCGAEETQAECPNCVGGGGGGGGDPCRLSLQPQTTLFRNSVMVRAGRLPALPWGGRATAVRVAVSGRWGGKGYGGPGGCSGGDCEEEAVTVVYGPGKANTVEGAEAEAARQIWSHLAVREALQACPLAGKSMSPFEVDEEAPSWMAAGCAWGVPGATVAEAEELAVEAGLVTPLTSLVVRREERVARRADSNATASANATAGEEGGGAGGSWEGGDEAGAGGGGDGSGREEAIAQQKSNGAVGEGEGEGTSKIQTADNSVHAMSEGAQSEAPTRWGAGLWILLQQVALAIATLTLLRGT